jgi:signal transduction histidine kinase
VNSGSVRFRITLVAAAVVAVVLAAAGAVLVLLQRDALTRSIDQTLAQRADDILSLVDEGESPKEFATGSDEGFTQLVAADGAVVAATPNLAEDPPLDIGVGTGEVIRSLDVSAVDDDVFRVLSRPVNGGVLHVGTTYDVVTESTTALIGSLAITIPVVVAVLAALIWWLVGRTLRPVEDIRSEVAAIGSTDLRRRVPRPGTKDEIDRLATTMNEMLERLESSAERQQRFVADASHELRGPLTRLRAELELGLSSASPSAEADELRSLWEEVVGMQETVEDLLFLAQSDAGKADKSRAAFDLDDLVLREGKRIAGDGRVEVDLSAVSGAHLSGNRSQVGRAVKNILDNAERHAFARVVVGLEEREGFAYLAVEDDGPGIPLSGVEQVFERFGRLDEARGAGTGGSGLGLAIARDIAVRHGGSLVVVNPGEPGARFEMTLQIRESS